MAYLCFSPIVRFGDSGSGGGASSGTGAASVNYRTLYRSGSSVPANTTISFNTPGPGWSSNGDVITFSGSAGFITGTQFFHNGQLVVPGENAAADNDVYYISDTSFAFEFPITKNDVIQIWQFTTTSG